MRTCRDNVSWMYCLYIAPWMAVSDVIYNVRLTYRIEYDLSGTPFRPMGCYIAYLLSLLIVAWCEGAPVSLLHSTNALYKKGVLAIFEENVKTAGLNMQCGRTAETTGGSRSLKRGAIWRARSWGSGGFAPSGVQGQSPWSGVLRPTEAERIYIINGWVL